VASLKRHGYYCRTRRGVKRPDLPRSCMPCARSKVRCDKNVPRCLKCTTKNLDCRYPTNGAQNVGSETSRLRFHGNAETTLSEIPGLLESNPKRITQCTDEPCSQLGYDTSFEFDLLDVRGELLEWDLSNPASTTQSTNEVLQFEHSQDTLPIDHRSRHHSTTRLHYR
jgi:hypothetical protein